MLRLEVLDYAGPAHWRWRLTDAQGAFLADHVVDLDEGEWQLDAFSDLYRYLRVNVAPDRRLAHEAELVVQVGAWIGERVLGPVALELARARGPVRVEVPAEAAGLAYRPWELAMVEGRPLVAHRVTFVIDQQQPSVPKAEVGDRLRMLAVFSLPEDAGALNLRKERFALARMVHEIAAVHNKGIELRVLQYGATRQRLKDALLEADGWDVVHLSGHGLPAGLVLEDDEGKPDVITSTDLVELLELARDQIKLVMLSACESAAVTAAEQLQQLGLAPAQRISAAVGEGGSLPAVASEVVRRLDCAVLAMRYPVVDDFAVSLAELFYDLVLGNGQPISVAMPLSLVQVAGGAPTPSTPPLSVATPTLFGARAMDLRLVPPSGQPFVFQVERQRLAEFPPQPPKFVGRVGPMTRASMVLAARSGRPAVVLHGMAGAGKTACALELAYTHQESFPAMAWYEAPPEGHAITTALTDCALALERQLPGLRLAHLANDVAVWRNAMPGLTEALEQARVLIVLDNVESLLTDGGEWRDERWSVFVRALTNHQGLSRVIVTSRRRPIGLADTVLVEPVHALSLAEAVLLAREWPRLRALMDRDETRDLAARTLMVVQGHPKLIELAEGRAQDPAVLKLRLDEADQVWQERGTRLEPFLSGEDPAATAEDYLSVLSGWTRATTAALSTDAALLCQFLCCVEPDDRISVVIGPMWAAEWRRSERDGDAPDPDTAARSLVEQGLAAVEFDTATGSPIQYRIHPGVAETVRAAADAEFRSAVDTVVGDGWLATFRDAVGREGTDELGQWALRAARSAAPYLLRQQRWTDLNAAAEQVLFRDQSTATAAALLPVLAAAVEATRGTDEELVAGGTRARALSIIDPGEAEPELRHLLDTAVAQERFGQAAVSAGDLLNLYRDSGRLEQALALADAQAEYSDRAGLGPWSRLATANQRLRILLAQGNYQQVLDAVEQYRDTMATLPDASERVVKWAVREGIVGCGVLAARQLGRWEQALDLNLAVRQSKRDRDASQVDQARSAFNDYGSLLGMGRAAEARDLLHECRAVFDTANDIPMVAKTLGALADVEDELGHVDRAVGLGGDALRLQYVAVDPEAIAISHHNLANYLSSADADPRVVWSHRLVDAVVCYQTGSGGLARSVQSVAITQAPTEPTSFDEVCAIVDSAEGVHFALLFARLPSRAATGQAAIDEVLQLAGDMRATAIQEAVTSWEPVLSALVATRSGADIAGQALDDALSTVETQPNWKGLVSVLRRIQAGEDDPGFADDLDFVDTAVVRRALDGLAGTADVDPEAWHVLIEQT